MIHIEWIFVRAVSCIEAHHLNSSFPEGVRTYRFNCTQLPKTDGILNITKLMSYINFRTMIQAVLGDQKKRKLRFYFRSYLYSNINTYFQDE